MRSQRISNVAHFKLLFSESPDRIHCLIMLAATVSIFMFDLVSPLGVAAGAPYVLVVFGSLWIKSHAATYVAAAVGLFFTATGFFLSTSIVSPIDTVIINRILTALLIVSAALIVIRMKKADASISKLKIQSVIDSLTHNKNWLAFEQDLSSEMLRDKRYNRNLTVAIMDIDHLGKFNQAYGRDCGDDIIVKVAKEITNNIRRCDILYRLVGGKFAVLFAEAGMRDTKRVGEAICKKVSDKVEFRDQKITLSTGIAALEESDSKRSLCQRAEDALLKSKTDGRNRVTTVPPVSTKDAPHIAAILTRPRY